MCLRIEILLKISKKTSKKLTKKSHSESSKFSAVQLFLSKSSLFRSKSELFQRKSALFREFQVMNSLKLFWIRAAWESWFFNSQISVAGCFCRFIRKYRILYSELIQCIFGLFCFKICQYDTFELGKWIYRLFWRF